MDVDAAAASEIVAAGPLVGAEHDSLRGVQIGRRDEELMARGRELVAPARRREDGSKPLLGSVGRVEGRRQSLGQRPQSVDDRGRKRMTHVAAKRAQDPDRPPDQGPQEPDSIQPHHLVRTDPGDSGRRVPQVGEDEVLGRDPVGETCREDGPRRRSHVEIEVVDGGALAHRIHRVEHPEVIGGARDAPTPEDERDPPGVSRSRGALGLVLCVGLGEVDDGPHAKGTLSAGGSAG